jgi:hypothetical protein
VFLLFNLAWASLSPQALASTAFIMKDEDSLRMPVPGAHQLRILSPTLLELTLITTKDPDPATVRDWNFVNSSFQFTPPATSEFNVLVGGQSRSVQAVGFKRRPIYAPLTRRDLRIGNHLYLRLSAPITDGQSVEVRNPSGNLWSTNRQFTAVADPLRYNPAIHVNQHGYIPDLPKKAMVGYYIGSMGEMAIPFEAGFRIVNAANGNVVHQGSLTLRRDVGYTYSPTPYQQVYQADFSSFRTPGEYRLQVPGLGASFPFSINDGVAGVFARTYALGLYHQRCGGSNEHPFTRHTHGACHTALVEIPDMTFTAVNNTLANVTSDFNRNPRHTAPQLKDVNSSLYPFVNRARIDVSGGHHDAGDYSKYTINVAQLIHSLVFAADAFPGVADLDNLGLPESGDGKSDVLQLAKWEADFLAKLQDSDGGFYFLVYPRNRRYEDNVLPDKGDPQVVFPKNTAATAAAVAALAQAASSPRFKQQFPQAAALYLDRARKGWDFLQAAFAKHGRDGSYQKITHYGDYFMHDDEIAWAAAEMYLATGEAKYHNELLANFDPASSATKRWGWWRMFESYGCAIRSYAFAARTGRLNASQLNATFLGKCEAEIRAAAADQTRFAAMNAYGTSFPEPNKPFRSAGWYFSLDQAYDIAVGYQLDARADYMDAMVSNMNYEGGSNPINMSFITGLGWRQQREIVHHYAQNDHRILPPTGIPQGNIQGGMPYLHHYKGELTALSFPADNANVAPYAPYDKWADTFNTTAEFVNPQQGRGLGVLAWLFARTSVKSQAWRGVPGQITGLPGSIPAREQITARLTAPGIDLSQARIIWEARDQEPVIASEFKFAAVNVGPQWVEAEAILPDGRRIFAATNFTATTATDVPPNSFQSAPLQVTGDMVALYRLDANLADATGRQPALTLNGKAKLDTSNLGWLVNRTGAALRIEDLGDQAVVSIPNSALFATDTQSISVEAMIYINEFKAYNRSNALMVSLRKGWNASLELIEDLYNGPIFRGGSQLNLSGQTVRNALPRNQWHHLRITIDKTGYAVVINGTVFGRVNSGELNNWAGGGSTTLTLGNFDGWIDEVVVRHVRSSTQSNQPPQVALTAPVAGTSFTRPVNITLSATATDLDGSVARVEFFQGTTKLGETTSSPYSFVWTNAPAGTFNLTARATDNQGASTTSGAVSITVQEGTASTVATPGITPNGGTFTNSVQVSIASSTSGATITYTTDGSTPTSTSRAYTGPFTVSSSATVRARAFKSGMQESAVGSASFTINFGNTEPPTEARASFVKLDTETQGTWKGVYGSDGFNIIGNAVSYPAYAQVTPQGKQDFVWSYSTTNVVALQKPGTATDRILSCWYSPTTFTVDVRHTDGHPHRIALYCLDWSTTDRVQRVEVLDTATGAVLDTQTLQSFHGGQYLIWDITGNVRFRFTRLGGANAVLMGIFFDPVATTDGPVKTNPRRGSNGKFQMEVNGKVGQRIVIEASTNSVNWQPISTNVLTEPVLQFEDPEAMQYSTRFYRARADEM